MRKETMITKGQVRRLCAAFPNAIPDDLLAAHAQEWSWGIGAMMPLLLRLRPRDVLEALILLDEVRGEDYFSLVKRTDVEFPALPRPSREEIRSLEQEALPRGTIIYGIERDTSETAEVKLSLATVLRPGEGSIEGAQYERRIGRGHVHDLLGIQHLLYLDQLLRELRAKSSDAYRTLVEKVKDTNALRIDFPGLIVETNWGRCIPYLGGVGPLAWRAFGEFTEFDRIAAGERIPYVEVAPGE